MRQNKYFFWTTLALFISLWTSFCCVLLWSSFWETSEDAHAKRTWIDLVRNLGLRGKIGTLFGAILISIWTSFCFVQLWSSFREISEDAQAKRTSINLIRNFGLWGKIGTFLETILAFYLVLNFLLMCAALKLFLRNIWGCTCKKSMN